MKKCPNCNSEIEDSFELCWNCNYSLTENRVVEIKGMTLQQGNRDLYLQGTPAQTLPGRNAVYSQKNR